MGAFSGLKSFGRNKTNTEVQQIFTHIENLPEDTRVDINLKMDLIKEVLSNEKEKIGTYRRMFAEKLNKLRTNQPKRKRDIPNLRNFSTKQERDKERDKEREKERNEKKEKLHKELKDLLENRDTRIEEQRKIDEAAAAAAAAKAQQEAALQAAEAEAERLENKLLGEIKAKQKFEDNKTKLMTVENLDLADYESMDTNHVGLEEIGLSNVQNKIHNRYGNVLPNPHSRVKLAQVGDDPTSTYINANFIEDAHGNSKRYIAAQGPLSNRIDRGRKLPNTMGHFWRMIWQENVRAIVMVTGLMEGPKAKCARYWPEELYDPDRDTKYMTHANIKIMVKSGARRQGYKLAELEVSYETETRTIKHFWYDDWPDYGVPEDMILVPKMLLDVREWSPSPDKPWVVHCSAGIGRTGTFIGIDIGMELLEKDKTCNVITIIEKMRQGRGGMVQTPEQANFLHKALKEYAEMKNNSKLEKLLAGIKPFKVCKHNEVERLKNNPGIQDNDYLIRYSSTQQMYILYIYKEKLFDREFKNFIIFNIEIRKSNRQIILQLVTNVQKNFEVNYEVLYFAYFDQIDNIKTLLYILKTNDLIIYLAVNQLKEKFGDISNYQQALTKLKPYCWVNLVKLNNAIGDEPLPDSEPEPPPPPQATEAFGGFG